MKINTSISIDSELKKEAQSLFKELNMDLSTAISIFLSQSVRERGIPFSIGLEIPNKDTIAALNEYSLIKKDKETYHRYDNVEELKKEINEDILKYQTSKYKIVRTNAFNKDIEKAVKRGFDTNKLYDVVEMLADGKKLPSKYKDHVLIGNFDRFRECHIQSDWLLIYRIDEEEIELLLFRNGTHSDLF